MKEDVQRQTYMKDVQHQTYMKEDVQVKHPGKNMSNIKHI